MLTKRGIVALVIECLLLTGLAVVVYSQRDQLEASLNLTAVHITGIFALIAIGAAVRGLEFHTAIDAIGVRMSYREAFSLTQATTLLNYLPMQAGTLIRARALKRHRALSYARYAAVMTSLVLVTMTSASILGLSALLATWPNTNGASALLAGIFLAVLMVAVLVTSVPVPGLTRTTWFFQRVSDLLEGWKEIRASRARLISLLAIALTTLCVISGRILICLAALGLPAEPLIGILLATGTSVTVIVSITPGSVGVREAVVAALGATQGLGFADVLIAVSIDRGLSFVFSLVVGGHSLLWLRRHRII